MSEKISYVAKLSTGYGDLWVEGRGAQEGMVLERRSVERADDNGDYANSGIASKVNSVTFAVEDSSCPMHEREYSIPFSRYVEWGRPKKISVTKTVSLEPIDS